MCRRRGWFLVLSTHGSCCGSRGWPPPCPSDAGTDPSTTETYTNPSTEGAGRRLGRRVWTQDTLFSPPTSDLCGQGSFW